MTRAPCGRTALCGPPPGGRWAGGLSLPPLRWGPRALWGAGCHRSWGPGSGASTPVAILVCALTGAAAAAGVGLLCCEGTVLFRHHAP